MLVFSWSNDLIIRCNLSLIYKEASQAGYLKCKQKTSDEFRIVNHDLKAVVMACIKSKLCVCVFLSFILSSPSCEFYTVSSQTQLHPGNMYSLDLLSYRTSQA